MNRLSSYLFRVAVLSVLVGVAVIIALTMFGDWLTYSIFVAGLPAESVRELEGDGPLSIELSNALNAFYTGWQARAVMPLSIAVGTLMGGLVGMVHSRRLMRPLDAVAAALALLAQGDTTARAKARPSNIHEIDDFQNNFNVMADAVAGAEREFRDTNAAIAHELRTPLTVLIGRLNGMADGIFPMDDTSIRALLTQTGQLHRIIDDLNLLTLAEAGRFQLYRERVDMAALMGAAVLADQGPIETDLRPALVYADPARLRQMLAALLDNARRYGGQGLRVETGIAGKMAQFRVMDRGPGLTRDQAMRVFDKFWRAEASRNKASGGTGLGLAVTRSLATAHGGSIRYDDRPGGGAVFTVSIPLAQLRQGRPLR